MEASTRVNGPRAFSMEAAHIPPLLVLVPLAPGKLADSLAESSRIDISLTNASFIQGSERKALRILMQRLLCSVTTRHRTVLNKPQRADEFDMTCSLLCPTRGHCCLALSGGPGVQARQYCHANGPEKQLLCASTVFLLNKAWHRNVGHDCHHAAANLHHRCQRCAAAAVDTAVRLYPTEPQVCMFPRPSTTYNELPCTCKSELESLA